MQKSILFVKFLKYEFFVNLKLFVKNLLTIYSEFAIINNVVRTLQMNWGGDSMANQNKIFITAPEMAEMLGVSVGHAYKIIRSLNQELKKDGYIVIAGKVPKGYFEKRWFGYSA